MESPVIGQIRGGEAVRFFTLRVVKYQSCHGYDLVFPSCGYNLQANFWLGSLTFRKDPAVGVYHEEYGVTLSAKVG